MNAHTFLLERLERRLSRPHGECPQCHEWVLLDELQHTGPGPMRCAACAALPRATVAVNKIEMEVSK